ncbi:hypothetical protein [Streptomyces spongiae]|uniref:Uncharacterized protein n=1 Tax=Streptomyces spongiae TaxID=565072 RepID=A0A5N8XSV1_9ACTN|nr:hypothetical protein [Streptomyces spongiae]MPY62481.1 hypothetical protein [Streptomyces spongiae]
MISSRSTHTSTHTKKSWSASLRSPWTVACATVAVVLGPSAVTASALERANSAPLHRPAAPDREPHREPPHHAAPYAAAEYAYLPRSPYRGQALNRSQSLG